MNILFIAPYVPSRIRVRPFQFIKELAKRHRIYVVALADIGVKETEGAEELADLVADLRVVPHSKCRGYLQSLLAIPTAVPMCAAFCWSRAMGAAVAKAYSDFRFDVVHLEHLRAAHFARYCGDIPVVFDSVDCLTSLFSQMAGMKKNPLAKLIMLEEAWKLRSYEPRILRRFNRVIVTSDSERENLLRLGAPSNTNVVPNGVDTDYFAPMNVDKVDRRIVFSGKMSYAPNAQAAIWFAEKVLPILRSKWSDTQFVIVGSRPPTSVRKLADVPGVTVTGHVNDIRPYLASSVLAVAPMQTAVGVQNKVLEALAMALPVVASPLATRAIGVDTPGLLEADTPQEVADAISSLFDNPSAAAEMGKAGRDAVARKFSWTSSASILERIYAEVLEEKARWL